jgi:signal transduction histidine kinase
MHPEITTNQQNEVTANHQESALLTHLIDTQEDLTWFEAESIRTFMPMQRQTQIITLFVIPLVFALLYDSVYLPGLYAWTLVSAIFITYRWWLSSKYLQHVYKAGDNAQLKFRDAHSWTWSMSAVLWSLLDWLFFSQTSMNNQVICWIVLAGIGLHSTTSYSPHIKTMKLFINAMMFTLLVGMAGRFIFNTQAAITSLVYVIIPLLFLFWRLIFNAGTKMHNTHMQGLKLLKGNEKLIASLKAQTARANHAVATKNRLLASAAHDIRQPVLALEMYASMLKSEPEHVAELTDKVCQATTSVINMFDSLFDLSRLESNQININKTIVHVPELLRELELQYEPAAKAKNLALKMRAKQFDIYTDHQLLKRVLGNLIMNAIKFTNKGGVLLACRLTSNGIRFEVWDTGIGIAPDQQEAVFREFYKAPEHTGTSDGFGLGLAIVSRLCEQLEFHFSMKSKLGRGSVFCIEAPSLVCFTVAANPADVHKK